MNEHRVPMLGAALRRHVDPAHSSDPKVRELVGALAGLEVAPAPRAEFRAELRAQLVAVAPRLVVEGEPQPVAAASPKRAERAPKAERARGFRLAKPLIAAACVLTAFVLLLGGAVLISRHALPGDALYGIKRASEDTEYSLTGGEVAKGKLKLEFAARRIGEVSDLLPRANALSAGTGAIADSGAINPDTAGLVRDTLGSARADVESAAQMLGSNAVRNDNAAPLAAIGAWTPAQISAMRQIVARIPAGDLHGAAVQTLSVLRQAQQRASALRGELGCSCLNSSNSDNFGPIPCTGPCTSVAPPGRQPGAHPSTKARPHGSGTAVRPGHTASTPVGPATKSGSPTATPPHPVTHPVSSPATGTGSKSPVAAPTSPTVPVVPTLPGLHGGTGSGSPNHGPHLPVSVSSCGVGVSVGGLNVGTGGC